MIDVIIKTDNKILKKIHIKGHSNFASKGKDIVCAAVSILVYAAYLSLITIPLMEIEYIDNKDELYLGVKKNNKEFFGELRGISIYLFTGINALAKDYSDNINLVVS